MFLSQDIKENKNVSSDDGELKAPVEAQSKTSL
jgi:hypothetical protein